MPTDLEIIAQIDKKIHQLPVKFLLELDDYIDFLLKKQEHISVNKVKKSSAEITDADIDAVCGVYQADRTVTLEQMEEAIVQGALNGCDFTCFHVMRL